MITNTYVSLREWFYPIGNTPAVNLLRDVRPTSIGSKAKQDIELLLLACGDPRNILFSLSCLDSPCEPTFLVRNLSLADKRTDSE